MVIESRLVGTNRGTHMGLHYDSNLVCSFYYKFNFTHFSPSVGFSSLFWLNDLTDFNALSLHNFIA